MSADRPILYSFRRCPYAMRARMALVVAGHQVELREVVLRNKPVELLDASSKGTVPVLVLPTGEVIDESLDVMDWALAQHDPQNWTDTENNTAQRDLIKACDRDFKPQLDRYKYPNRYPNEDLKDPRGLGLAWLKTHLTERLNERAYLFGPSPGLADIAIFPFVRQFANTDRDWFSAAADGALVRWLGDL
ncbi:MAG: glutathione S-transferase, partial [Pseudomonadota bacterium]